LPPPARPAPTCPSSRRPRGPAWPAAAYSPQPAVLIVGRPRAATASIPSRGPPAPRGSWEGAARAPPSGGSASRRGPQFPRRAHAP
jgi:hypothetical protein